MKLDFKNKDQLNSFPKHGWAPNSDDIELLWLPLLRILLNTNKTRKSLNLSKCISNKHFNDICAFVQTVDNLAITLQELSHTIRSLSKLDIIDGDNDSLNTAHHLRGLIRIYTDSSIVYIRRVADDFCRSLRFVLFEDFDSAPRKLKKLISDSSEDTKLTEIGLVCDIDDLRKILGQYTEWFRDIRGMNRDGIPGKKGIRDILDHNPSSIEIAHSQTNDQPWETQALLRYLPDGNVMPLDLICFIKNLVSQLCEFWTELYKVLPLPQNKYKSGANLREGDVLYLIGNTSDITNMWPEI